MHWMWTVTQNQDSLEDPKLECYDDRKLINHGSIKLRLQHYLEKSFQDHSFYVVETKTLKPIFIGHPASIRLGLIWVLCKNISKSVLVIEKTGSSSKNSFQDHQLNIDGNTPCKWQRSKYKSPLDHTQNSFQDHGKNAKVKILSRPSTRNQVKVSFQDHPPTVPKTDPKQILTRPSSLKICQKRVLSRPVRMDPKTTLLSRPWVKMTK